jgi:phosphoenolpyruvate carboxykinase (ATP)
MNNASKTLRKVHEYLRKTPLICVSRSMCKNDFTLRCRLFVSVRRKDHVRLAYMFAQSFFDDVPEQEPNLYLIDIPEWQEKDRQILVFPASPMF